jgi:hypothetical protein
MQKPHRIIWSLARIAMLCAALLMTAPVQVRAYADPGTGAFLYQASYAAFLGGVFYFRKFLDRVFNRRK